MNLHLLTLLYFWSPSPLPLRPFPVPHKVPLIRGNFSKREVAVSIKILKLAVATVL